MVTGKVAMKVVIVQLLLWKGMVTFDRKTDFNTEDTVSMSVSPHPVITLRWKPVWYVTESYRISE